MKISAQLAVWLCAAFGLVCLSVAISGFSAAPSVADAVEREASLGYAWFWSFLALVAAVFGVLSWMMAKGKFGPAE
jgi:dipeptide/tripeptide permease